MIHVHFEGCDTPEWRAWCERAERGRAALIAKARNGEPISINKRLYTEMREVIFRAFHNKCAYCETKLDPGQNGQVEHYRPKGAVQDENGRPVLVEAAADEPAQSHPGYYWLAYDWHNLLPTCEKCNQTPKRREPYGKGNRFPVEGRRWCDPEEQDQEHPLLLNPRIDNPHDHLILDGPSGRLAWKTPKGEVTVRILGLNREGLVEARKKAYARALMSIRDAGGLAGADMDSPEDRLLLEESLATLARIIDGEEAYSWAGYAAISEKASALLNYLRLIEIMRRRPAFM